MQNISWTSWVALSPSDNQLLHIMVGAMTTGDLGMETKWGPVALDRLLGQRMDAFEMEIPTSKNDAGPPDDSIHAPPPCTYTPSPPTGRTTHQERAEPPRCSDCAANLGTGWENYSASSSDGTGGRSLSADPPVGGNGEGAERFQNSPWNIDRRAQSSSSGQAPRTLGGRKEWNALAQQNALISTFQETDEHQSPVNKDHSPQ